MRARTAISIIIGAGLGIAIYVFQTNHSFITWFDDMYFFAAGVCTAYFFGRMDKE